MTVVLGQHFFQGVVVIADSRASIEKNGHIIPWRDNTQKIFFLTPDIIIGFSGDVEFAGAIISFIAEQIRLRPKLVLINNFFDECPKLIKYAYNVLAKERRYRSIGFIVAGLDRLSTDNVGFYDKKIFKISAPSFDPHYVTINDPFAIMGSGEPGIRGLEEDFRKMQFGQLSRSLSFEALIMAGALKDKIKSLGITTVGGLFQIAIIDNEGPRFQGYQGKRDTFSEGDLDVEMLVKDGRFIQRDLKTGEEIMLLYPPEVVQIKEDKSKLFADIDKL